jgi:hypothetical protein
MSPRRNRPRRRWLPGRPGRPDQPVGDRPGGLDLERLWRGAEAVESWAGESWRVRQVPGGAAVKAYRCPGCDQEIPPGVPHLVVWPLVDPVGSAPPAGLAERRHWHSGCWQARDRRRPAR